MIEINLNKMNKSFGNNHVLNDIDITVKTGEKIFERFYRVDKSRSRK